MLRGCYTVLMYKLAEKILAQWDNKSGNFDVGGLEDTLADVLNSTFSDKDKIALAKEAIDAYTRRGHFKPTEYYWSPEGN